MYLGGFHLLQTNSDIVTTWHEFNQVPKIEKLFVTKVLKNSNKISFSYINGNGGKKIRYLGPSKVVKHK